MTAKTSTPSISTAPLRRILGFDDLRAIARLGPRSSLARVETWARSCGIPYQYDAKGGIWTTIDAVNSALGVTSALSSDSAYSADRYG